MENTKIEWATNTFNPWQGCTKVSQGCKYCYAEALSKRWGRDIWGPNTERVRTSEAYWRKPLAWDRQAQKDGTRPRVFCASMADVFEDHPQLHNWRVDLFALIEDTPNLDWLLLTKRPENVNRMIELAWGGLFLHKCKNVWIGTSIENQEAANERIPYLLDIPARVRFLSCEPLLGPVDLRGIPSGRIQHDPLTGYQWGFETLNDGTRNYFQQAGAARINWVIAGGESGLHARPVDLDWVRSLRDQCQEAGVPFFFKQVGGKNKKAAGRLLDGREWSEFPR